MVRDTLGEDAIIVATREEQGGKSVRVTAAVEQHDSYEDDGFALADNDFGGPNFELETESFAGIEDPDDWLQYDDECEEGAVVEELTDVLLRHAASDEITDQIISCATILGMDRADLALTAALEHLFSFRPIPQASGGTAYMVVGPPGTGKTLAVAKLAARAVMNGKKAAVITTDTVRAGGVEQLSAFTKLMNVRLFKAANPKQLAMCLERVQGVDQVYIDTAGANPFDPAAMRDVARLASAGDIDPVLALPAGLDTDESGEISRAFATIGVNTLMPTRIDIARRLGGILSAAHHGGLIFAEASNTPKVAEGLIALTPKRLTTLLMPESAKLQTGSSTKSPRAGISAKKQTANAG